ncbi:glycosyl transferase [Photorhabdus luminescens subsp. luminescens]|uniref:Glycosyltransferase involved in cell wall bisynthesis n=1 Tax=Photorhabdus luminescens TaxID=29488 RepID=A0A1G5R7E2_PHOLU|nr:glycosyltransferase family 4 protein [Photorhabdus luminescens]KMW71707.1 glycosyl transferase [Photorhabdus luminescens subsp. luminescens]SCZ69341.1 Glycosyltransferase involved in cell wall bisynthesis [Photorhabdus luminescens]
MNILYINHYAGSPKYGMEFRPYYLAQEWLKYGHKTTILASSFSHVRARQPNVGNKITEENINGINYIWYPTRLYNGNGISRVMNIFSFLFQVFLDLNKKRNINKIKPDVVIASSTYPLDILVAKHIARKSGAKLIYEVHDLWPLSPIEIGGMSPKHPFIRLCQFAENFAYRHSDTVISMLPNVHAHMKAHGLDLKKLNIIPNGIVEEDWNIKNISPITSHIREVIDYYKSENKIIVGYAGSLGKPNAMNYLIDAAKLLENENFHFLLVGSGLEKGNLIKQANLLNLRNITFCDPIPKTQIPFLLPLFDIAYIGWNRKSIYRFGISPNKLIDYMMAKCIVLHSVEAGNDIVADANCGLSTLPESPQAIANGLLKLNKLSKEKKIELGNNGKKYVLKNHTYNVLSEKFLKAIINHE